MAALNLKSLVLRNAAVVAKTVNVVARKGFGAAIGQYPALLSQGQHSSPKPRLGTTTEPWCEGFGRMADSDCTMRGAGRLQGFAGVRPCGELRIGTVSSSLGLRLRAAF